MFSFSISYFLFNLGDFTAAAMLYILFCNSCQKFFGSVFVQSHCSAFHLLFLISFHFMANLLIKCTSFHAFHFEMCQISLPLRSPSHKILLFNVVISSLVYKHLHHLAFRNICTIKWSCGVSVCVTLRRSKQPQLHGMFWLTLKISGADCNASACIVNKGQSSNYAIWAATI